MTGRKARTAPEAAPAAAMVLSDVEHELTSQAPTAGAILAALAAFELATDADALWAGEKLHEIKAKWKEYEERRTSVTAPLNATLATVNGWFKGVQGPLREAEALLKGKVADYQRRRRVEQTEAMLAVSAGDTAALARTAPTAPLAGVSTREEWTVEVVDPDQVPRAFCAPDMVKLKASRDWSAYDDGHPPPPIPGVRFVRRARVTVRS